MKNGTYFLLLLFTCCWYSCSSPDNTTTEGDTTVQEDSNVTESTTTAPAMTHGASKITEQVISQVCDCKKEAMREDGSMDIERIRACMGAESMPKYVERLLGPSATEKEYSDATQLLGERTAAC